MDPYVADQSEPFTIVMGLPPQGRRLYFTAILGVDGNIGKLEFGAPLFGVQPICRCRQYILRGAFCRVDDYFHVFEDRRRNSEGFGPRRGRDIRIIDVLPVQKPQRHDGAGGD